MLALLSSAINAGDKLDFQRLALHYTAGEPIEPLRAELEDVIAAYERYGEHLWKYTGDRNEVVFKFYSLDDYCELMQLIGLCFLLHRRDLLPRLAALQDGENGTSNGGADTLYEEFMAFGIGPETRFETDHLCQVAPYENLFYALTETTPEKGLKELNLFLKHWYKDLAGTGWHDSHKTDEEGNQGGYFGYWSFEAGAAVLLLGIEDDSSLHKYLYYPKDLVAWAKENADRFPDGGLNTKTDKQRANVPAGSPLPRNRLVVHPRSIRFAALLQARGRHAFVGRRLWRHLLAVVAGSVGTGAVGPFLWPRSSVGTDRQPAPLFIRSGVSLPTTPA